MDMTEIKRALEEAFGPMRDRIKGLEVNMTDLGQKFAGRSEGGYGSSHGGALASVITKAMEKPEFQAFRERRASRVKIELGDAMTKAVAPIYEGTDPNQFPVAPDRRPGIVIPGASPLRIRNLLPTVRTNGGMIEYVRETAFNNNANYQVAENDLKAQSDMQFELDQMPVATIAHWALASAQVLDDAPGLSAYLQQRLLFGLKLKEDRELLAGDGSKGKLSGLLLNATAFPGGSGTAIDAIRSAITILQTAGYTPTGCVVNPSDAEAIDTVKTTTGEYVMGGPGSTSGTVWTVPLVQSVSIPQGQFLIADFGAGTTLFDRQDADVLFSREDSDNFRRNMVTALAEERLALIVWDKAALVTGPFAAPPVGKSKPS
jgi:HK97 family phage major capsid protein